MKARYSYVEIVASLSAEKNRADSLWTRLVLRPLSFSAAWVFLRAGFSPNAVSYLSIPLCLAAFVLMASGATWGIWTGIALFFVFSVLDCADGNMARTQMRPNPWGDWADAIGGYFAYTAVLLGMGAAAEATRGRGIPGLLELPTFWPGGWVLVGSLAAAGNLLMRLCFQAFRAVEERRTEGDRTASEGKPAGRGIGGEKRLSESIGITGALVPLLAAAAAAGLMSWVTLAYAVVYCGGCLAVVAKLVLRAERSSATGEP